MTFWTLLLTSMWMSCQAQAGAKGSKSGKIFMCESVCGGIIVEGIWFREASRKLEYLVAFYVGSLQVDLSIGHYCLKEGNETKSQVLLQIAAGAHMKAQSCLEKINNGHIKRLQTCASS